MSSGWFDCTEPSLSTLLQGKQGVQGAYALVRGGSSTSNLLEPQHHRDSKVWRVLSQEFGVVRLYRTFSIYIVTGEMKSTKVQNPRRSLYIQRMREYHTRVRDSIYSMR